MFKGLSALFSLMVLLIVGCAGTSFVPVHNYDNGTTLGQRTVSNPMGFAPGAQTTWMETCTRKVVKGAFGASTTYVEPCEVVNITGTHFVSFSPYVTGLATPIIQGGAIVGGAALIGNGISQSGSRSSNSTTNTNSASGGQGGSGTEYSGDVSNSGNHNSIVGDKNHHNEIEN